MNTLSGARIRSSHGSVFLFITQVMVFITLQEKNKKQARYIQWGDNSKA